MSDSLNAIEVLSYFPCSGFLGLLVCDGGDCGEMPSTKINSAADTSTFFANVTGLQVFIQQTGWVVMDSRKAFERYHAIVSSTNLTVLIFTRTLETGSDHSCMAEQRR